MGRPRHRELNELGIRPIVDLIHYGTTLWLDHQFAHPDYAQHAAAELGPRATFVHVDAGLLSHGRHRRGVNYYPLNSTEVFEAGVRHRGGFADPRPTFDAGDDGLREQGIPVVGYTWWPLFDMYEWTYRHSTRPRVDHLLTMGLVDLEETPSGTLDRTHNPVADRFAEYASVRARA